MGVSPKRVVDVLSVWINIICYMYDYDFCFIYSVWARYAFHGLISGGRWWGLAPDPLAQTRMSTLRSCFSVLMSSGRGKSAVFRMNLLQIPDPQGSNAVALACAFLITCYSCDCVRELASRFLSICNTHIPRSRCGLCQWYPLAGITYYHCFCYFRSGSRAVVQMTAGLISVECSTCAWDFHSTWFWTWWMRLSPIWTLTLSNVKYQSNVLLEIGLENNKTMDL